MKRTGILVAAVLLAGCYSPMPSKLTRAVEDACLSNGGELAYRSGNAGIYIVMCTKGDK